MRDSRRLNNLGDVGTDCISVGCLGKFHRFTGNYGLCIKRETGLQE